MDISKIGLLPLKIKFLGEEVTFSLRLDKVNDDYRDWISFRGVYKNDESATEITERDMQVAQAYERGESLPSDAPAPDAVAAPARFRTSTELIVRLVESWDITDNGEPVPVKTETVAPLNLTFKQAICDKIIETLDTKKLSAAPSHWLTISARKGR